MDTKTKPSKHKLLVLDQTSYKTIYIIYSTEQCSQSFNCLTPSVSQQRCRRAPVFLVKTANVIHFLTSCSISAYDALVVVWLLWAASVAKYTHTCTY